MMQATLTTTVAFLALVGTAASQETNSSLFESPVELTATSELDKIVFAQLASLGIQPVRCSDAVFVRRAFLDTIGTLPTAQEARAFIEDPDTEHKRTKLIDQLLERHEFADYWSMKWGDVLRVKAEFPINLWPNAAQAYHRWIHASIAQNKPYDEFVREMLTASGSNFRVGPVNFYRAMQNKNPEGTATTAALTFMGSRTESWPEGRLAGTAVFFSQLGYKPTREWKEENVFWDPDKSSQSAADGELVLTPHRTPLTGIFPDGTKVELPLDQDPREMFADWLITPENPWFTRSVVNRVWAWLLGRGIVHEPDDIREDNPPSNPQLLAFLEQELVDNHYDLKHLYRAILTSETYQFSSVPRFNSPEAIANFASYPLRRLEAEVLIDAINKITGTTDLYTSAIPEPFTYIPQDQPAIALADGSITSSFLALFGRSPRATGMENERDNKLVSAQWMHLLNSSHIQNKLEQGASLRAIINSRRKPKETVEELYLTILSRFPTDDELKTLQAFNGPRAMKRVNWVDVSWALINSTEFLFRH